MVWQLLGKLKLDSLAATRKPCCFRNQETSLGSATQEERFSSSSSRLTASLQRFLVAKHHREPAGKTETWFSQPRHRPTEHKRAGWGFRDESKQLAPSAALDTQDRTWPLQLFQLLYNNRSNSMFQPHKMQLSSYKQGHSHSLPYKRTHKVPESLCIHLYVMSIIHRLWSRSLLDKLLPKD